MPKQSAGILLYRNSQVKTEVLLVHPGGPFWAKKDFHSWSIPKGEMDEGENILDAAKREFLEETGIPAEGEFTELLPVKQKSGKTVFCFACKADLDASKIKSNTFKIEWPPKSGRMQTFPEVDKAEWFDIKTAMDKINEAQADFLTQLTEKLKTDW
ncbi:MAG TPA: NUDIX domain-containing protein [Bacteroidales bacterium]|nr:NUDIX domain-containing protein [Bacteroidales bacterium]